jgi:hypothetical protein
MRKVLITLISLVAILAVPFVWPPGSGMSDSADWQSGLRRWHPANIVASLSLSCASSARQDQVGLTGYGGIEGEARIGRSRVCLAVARALAVPGGGLEPYVSWERAWLDLALSHHSRAFERLLDITRTDGLGYGSAISFPFHLTWDALLFVAMSAEGQQRVELLSAIEAAFEEPRLYTLYVEEPADVWTAAYVEEGLAEDEAAHEALVEFHGYWAAYLGVVRAYRISALMDAGAWDEASELMAQADPQHDLLENRTDALPSESPSWVDVAQVWHTARLAGHRGEQETRNQSLDQLMMWIRDGAYEAAAHDMARDPSPAGVELAWIMDEAGRCADAIWLVEQALPTEPPYWLSQPRAETDAIWDRFVDSRRSCMRAQLLQLPEADRLCAQRLEAHAWLVENDTSHLRAILPREAGGDVEPLACAVQAPAP